VVERSGRVDEGRPGPKLGRVEGTVGRIGALGREKPLPIPGTIAGMLPEPAGERASSIIIVSKFRIIAQLF
jgi:hypothetical protein